MVTAFIYLVFLSSNLMVCVILEKCVVDSKVKGFCQRFKTCPRRDLQGRVES